MQQSENQQPAAVPKQENGTMSSAGTGLSNVGTSNTGQKGIHRGSRRQKKPKPEKPADATSATVSDVKSNQASQPQNITQKNKSSATSKPAPKESSEIVAQPKKSKPRPSKSARAKIRAAKASVTQEPNVQSTGIAESELNTEEPLSTTAPVVVSPSEEPLAKKEESGAIASHSNSQKLSKPTSEPTQKRSSQTKSPKKQTWKTAWMFKEITGAPLHTIDTTSLPIDSNPVSSSQGFETLCSYNWQNDGAIYVPGGPPKWTPPPLPFTLAQDKGRHYIDQNASRVPKYPFEPAFRALSLMNPNMNFNAVDIIANRNSLRKLLDLAAGKKLDPFCMGLHMINSTLVISRKERSAEYMIHGAPNSGYGHNFETSFTKPDFGLDKSSSHHRVIRYHIGSLDCVVRFEVDAYYEDSSDTGAAATATASKHTEDPTDSLTSALSNLHIADPIVPPQASRRQNKQRPSSDKPTVALEKGTFISPTALAEIKAKRLTRLADAMPQLWFGRTPYFINGKHEMGTVHAVSIIHASEEFAQWEIANQERLQKMVGLLVRIKRAVEETKEGAAVLVYDVKGGPLKIYRMKSDVGVLPKDVIGSHWAV